MCKQDFLEFYNNVIKELGLRLEREYEQFRFCDNPDSLYEEYLNQKTMLRILYEKKMVKIRLYWTDTKFVPA